MAFRLFLLTGLVWAYCVLPNAASAATTTVQVLDNHFVPVNITNKTGDTVQWTWGGQSSHSSTSSVVGPLWDSGVHGNGFSFTHIFPNAGNFPYRCVVHAGQTGSIVVKAAVVNKPPTVSILSPANGVVFAAPWSGTISVTASDSDGTVTNVDFFGNSAHLGALPNPTSSATWTVTNLAAGSYVLTAVATDNNGATNKSASVNIQVAIAGPISATVPTQLAPTTFEFSYSATPGLSYVVQRSADLIHWTPLSTNIASGTQVTFLDDAATGSPEFYSVNRLPNP